MVYTYDKHNLTFKKITKDWLLYSIGIIIGLTLLINLIIFYCLTDVRYISQETRAFIVSEATKANEFSPDKLRAYILELNIRFPHIVYAQARLETGNFKAGLFKTNKNLFAMRVATRRPTTNQGAEYGYAVYNTWRESVVDYAFFSAQYLSDIKTETEYFEYLKQNYAVDPTYVDRLKVIIEDEKRK